MRTKKELYEVILASYIKLSKENPHSANLFICHHIELCVEEGKITVEEGIFILEDFRSNRPSKTLHKEFTKGKAKYFAEECAWWVLCDNGLEEGIKIRIKFLRKLIKIN